jgi:hypothetical protein
MTVANVNRSHSVGRSCMANSSPLLLNASTMLAGAHG